MTSSSNLTSYCKLAGWAAFIRSQEVFDACGEIFEKNNLDVEITSPLGIRLTLFELHKQLVACDVSLESFVPVADSLQRLATESHWEAVSAAFDELRKLVTVQIGVLHLAKALGIANFDALDEDHDFNTKKFSNQQFKSNFSAFVKDTVLQTFFDEAFNLICSKAMKAYNIKKSSALALFEEHALDKFRTSACEELLRAEIGLFGRLEMDIRCILVNPTEAEKDWSDQQRHVEGPYAGNKADKAEKRGRKKATVPETQPAPASPPRPSTPPRSDSPPPVPASTKKADLAAASQAVKEKGGKLPTPVKDIQRSRKQLDEHTKGRDPLANALKQSESLRGSTVTKPSAALPKSDDVEEGVNRITRKRSRELDQLLGTSGAQSQQPRNSGPAATAAAGAPSSPSPKRISGAKSSAPISAPVDSPSRVSTRGKTAAQEPTRPSKQTRQEVITRETRRSKRSASDTESISSESISTESTASQHESSDEETEAKPSVIGAAASGLKKIAADIAAIRFPAKFSAAVGSTSIPAAESEPRDYQPRKKWTVEEEEALKKGMERHGSNWAIILQDEEFSEILRNRTNVNLKDKARNLAK